MELPEKDLEKPPPPFRTAVALRGGGGGGGAGKIYFGVPKKHLDSVDSANTLGEQIHTSIENFGRIQIKITKSYERTSSLKGEFHYSFILI